MRVWAKTFAAGGDTTGTFADYNIYYFFGTAGSMINASLERVDTSISWENPASLDPQLEIIAPDGVVYANLIKRNNRPGVDLNATLTSAVLPLTGALLCPGRNAQRQRQLPADLLLHIGCPGASRGARDRVFGQLQHGPLKSGHQPDRLHARSAGLHARRGGREFLRHRLAGRSGHGAVCWGSSDVTGPDGYAGVTIRLTSIGKAQIRPSFVSSLLSAATAILEGREGAGEEAPAPVPRYRPVAALPIMVAGLEPDWQIRVVQAERDELPVWQSKPRVDRSGSGEAGA